MGSRVAVGCVVALGGVMLSAVALAAELPTGPGNHVDYQARAGVSYSDNVTRASSGNSNSAAAVVGARLLATRPEGRFRYDAAGDLAYYKYFLAGIGGQLYGGMNGRANYDIVADTFSWGLQGAFNQIPEDLSRPAAYGNLENVITISTGPTLRVNLSKTIQATLDGHFARTDFSQRSFDNNTVGARIVIAHRLSSRSLIGAGGLTDRLSYAQQIGLGARSFDRREAFVRFNKEFVRTLVNFDAGSSSLKGGNVDEQNPVVRAHIAHRLTPSLSINAQYSQEFAVSDAAIFSIPPVAGSITDAQTSILTGGPRTVKSSSAGLVFRHPRTISEIGLSRYDESSLGPLPIRRSVDEYAVKVTRLLSPRSSATAFGRYSNDTATIKILEAKGYQIGANYSFAFDKLLGFECRVERRHASGSATANNFSETSFGVYVTYGREIGANRR